MKRIIALLGLILPLAASAVAPTNIDPRRAKLDVCGAFEIWHINGIMTDVFSATESLNKIKTNYGNSYKEHLVIYNLAYNRTQGFTSDMYQSAKQVVYGYVGATWDKFINAVVFNVYDVAMPAATAAAISKIVTDKYAFTKVAPYQDSDINTIMLSITSVTKWASRKVFVCHSQGNLYCNIVYDKLVASGVPAQTLGLMGVAVPYSSQRTGNNYVTSVNDMVIDATRIATLNFILPPNVNIPYQPSIDPGGHKIKETYLAHTVANGARDMIVRQITAEFDSLRTIAPSPAWAPLGNNGAYVSYSWVRYNPPCCGTVPSYYWWYLPEPPNAYTGGWSGYIYGSEAQAITAAITVGKTCYNYHIAEVKRKQALGDYSWTQIQGGCWGPLSDPWGGSWWPYSGDGTPVFRGKFVSAYANGGPGSIEVTAGATCKR
jgi:hypothetical protein